MKVIPLLALLILSLGGTAQNINGKWFGKLTQEPGGYRRIYNFELNVVQDDDLQKDSITGTSYAYIDYQIEARLGFTGHIEGDSIRLQESEYQIQEEETPTGWVVCIKNLKLALLKVDNKEFLRGRWAGVAKGQANACMPGLIILARNKKDLDRFIENNGYTLTNKPVSILDKDESATSGNDSGSIAGKGGESALNVAGPDGSMPVPDFNPIFQNTIVSRTSELEVENRELKLYLLDYSQVDNDSMTVYLNRRLIQENIPLTNKPIVLNLTLNERISTNELLLYANSLGDIPPNTAGIAIRDGDKLHKIKIQSDKVKTSAVYIKLKKPSIAAP